MSFFTLYIYRPTKEKPPIKEKPQFIFTKARYLLEVCPGFIPYGRILRNGTRQTFLEWDRMGFGKWMETITIGVLRDNGAG